MHSHKDSNIARALINEEKCRIAAMARRLCLIECGRYQGCAIRQQDFNNSSCSPNHAPDGMS